MGLFKKKLPWLVKIHFSFWLAYFIIFWGRAMEFDVAGNLYANHVNIWGDWAAHLTIVSKLAFDGLFTLESPFLINRVLSYPFASDFISAVLVKAGLPIFTSLILPSFFLSLFTVWALYYFFKNILHSKKMAVLASNLFLFNGGLGFIYFFQDLFRADQPWSIIWSAPQKYTNIEDHFYRFISVVNSMLIPQRAFVLGFPLALIALTLIYRHFFLQQHQHQKSLLRSIKAIVPIIILGLMPWLHTHSYLASFIILTFWFAQDLFKKNWLKVKDWLALAAGVFLISWPIIQLLFTKNLQNNFIKWQPGWYSYSYPEVNWWLFWLKNWGLVPLLALAGYYLILKGKIKSYLSRQQNLWFYLPFFIIFILLNLFLFQPFIWDNTKLLVWAAVGFYALTAQILVYLWRHAGRFWQKFLITLVFLSCVLAGGLDNFRALRFDLHHYQMYSHEDLALAEWVKNNTKADTVWLTGTQHNHWLYNLTGRQALMAYPGWLWTHGYKYRQVERHLNLMFKQPEENLTLFNYYQIDYVVIGPNEKFKRKAQPTEFALNHNFELIKESSHYQLYAYRPPKPVQPTSQN